MVALSLTVLTFTRVSTVFYPNIMSSNISKLEKRKWVGMVVVEAFDSLSSILVHFILMHVR